MWPSILSGQTWSVGFKLVSELLCPQITKEATHGWLKHKESWVDFLPFTHTHTHTHARTQTHTLLASSLWLLHHNFKGIHWEWARITVGRPLQQSRNASQHYQDYLPVKARRTQLSFSELIFALVSSWGMCYTERRKINFIFWKKTGFILTWCLSLQFLFHLSEFSSLFLQRFLQICTTQLKDTKYWWDSNLKKHFCCCGWKLRWFYLPCSYRGCVQWRLPVTGWHSSLHLSICPSVVQQQAPSLHCTYTGAVPKHADLFCYQQKSE